MTYVVLYQLLLILNDPLKLLPFDSYPTWTWLPSFGGCSWLPGSPGTARTCCGVESPRRTCLSSVHRWVNREGGRGFASHSGSRTEGFARFILAELFLELGIGKFDMKGLESDFVTYLLTFWSRLIRPKKSQ